MQVRQLTPDVLRNVLDVCGDDVLLQHDKVRARSERFGALTRQNDAREINRTDAGHATSSNTRRRAC